MKNLTVLLCFIMLFKLHSFAEDERKSDNYFNEKTLSQVIYEKIKIDGERNRIEYAAIKAKSILYNNDNLSDSIKIPFYFLLLSNHDIFNKLGIATQQVILKNIIKDEFSSKINFFQLTYRERDVKLFAILQSSFNKYFYLDFKNISYTNLSDSKIIPIKDFNFLEYKAKEILTSTFTHQ